MPGAYKIQNFGGCGLAVVQRLGVHGLESTVESPGPHLEIFIQLAAFFVDLLSFAELTRAFFATWWQSSEFGSRCASGAGEP